MVRLAPEAVDGPGVLAALAGVSTRTVRHYHHLGLLPEPERRANGYRNYRPRDAVVLARVRRLVPAEPVIFVLLLSGVSLPLPVLIAGEAVIAAAILFELAVAGAPQVRALTGTGRPETGHAG